MIAVDICVHQIINKIFMLTVNMQNSHHGFLAICKNDAEDFTLVLL